MLLMNWLDMMIHDLVNAHLTFPTPLQAKPSFALVFGVKSLAGIVIASFDFAIDGILFKNDV